MALKRLYASISSSGLQGEDGREDAGVVYHQDAKLFMSWDSLVTVLSFLPSVKPVRLVSKAHRAAVDGFLLVERGKVPLFPPLGFKTKKKLLGQDVYALVRFGEKAWRANGSIGWEEYEFLSSSLQTKLRARAEEWNKKNEVDLNVDLLPPIPADFVPDGKLCGLDIYGIRKYGVDKWKRKMFNYGKEYEHLSKRSVDRLWEEANRLNERHAIKEFSAPPLPPDFNPGCHLTAYDVYVIRKHMGGQNFRSSSWWDCKSNQAKSTWRKEYDRLSTSIQSALWAEANAVNERYKPAPTPLPPPLPSSFRTNKYLSGTDLYTIRKLGPEIWQSGTYRWSDISQEFNGLTSEDQQTLYKEAEELNKCNEITPKDLAAKFTITGDGVVCRRQAPPKKKRKITKQGPGGDDLVSMVITGAVSLGVVWTVVSALAVGFLLSR